MTSHETATETQRTVTPNCRNNNDLDAALDSAMDTPPTEPGLYGFTGEPPQEMHPRSKCGEACVGRRGRRTARFYAHQLHKMPQFQE